MCGTLINIEFVLRDSISKKNLNIITYLVFDGTIKFHKYETVIEVN